MTADLLHVTDTVLINRLAIRTLQALTDRMGRIALCKSCIFEQLLILIWAVVNTIYFKYALRHRTSLIEYDDLRL